MEEPVFSQEVYTEPAVAPKRTRSIALALLLALILLGGLLLNKGVLVAAMVNGKPIFRWDLNSVLTARFGQQTLEGMISEQLIADEARKEGVSVTEQDVQGRQQEILQSLGGTASLEDVLQYQGITKEEFDKQIRLQLSVEKILGKDLTITDQDVDLFIASNRALLVASDEAGLRAEAQKEIRDQKIGERVQSWFAEIKEKANIVRFLK